VVTGPAADVARFREQMIVTKMEEPETHWRADRKPEPYTTFDFNGVIPMPECLREAEESTAAEEGMALIAARGDRGAPFATLGLYQARIDYIRSEAGLAPDAAISDVAAAFLAKNPRWEEAGKARLLALAETGFVSWYPWAISNWGTKWGAYSFSLVADEPLTIKFDTAWGFPTPVFKALIIAFPTLTFDCVCFDEGWNFAGEGVFAADVTTFREVKATDAMYERVYLRKPERDEDDEDTDGIAAPSAADPQEADRG
jgi:hypothetical protein